MWIRTEGYRWVNSAIIRDIRIRGNHADGYFIVARIENETEALTLARLGSVEAAVDCVEREILESEFIALTGE